ncbi:MAG: arylsulfotransferase family protein [Parvularculaceae bacterium]
MASAIVAAATLCIVIGAVAVPVRGRILQSVGVVKQLARNWQAIYGIAPVEHLEPVRPYATGPFAPDPAHMARGVTFMTGLFGDALKARLVDENGAVIHEWPIDFFEQKKAKLYRFDALIHGAHLYENGDILIVLDSVGLYRVNACGEVIWKNENGSHHSIDIDDEGFIWTPLRAVRYNEPRILPGDFRLDRIGRVDPDTGALVETLDLVDILLRSDEQGLASIEPPGSHDLFHVNDVEILSARKAAAFPEFSAGDILVSARRQNMVFVIDRADRKVKWVRIGATQYQHDPDFQPDGSITVFDNRGSAPASRSNGWKGESGGSRIIAVRPGVFDYKVVYQSDFRNTFYSSRRGKHQRLENGNLLITETDAGRVFEATPSGDIVWRYVNRHDDANVGWVMSATRFPSDYVSIEPSCRNP